MEGSKGAGASEDFTYNGDGLSIPLGGPIYTLNLVGPLTTVPHFESSLLQELQVFLIHFSIHVFVSVFKSSPSFTCLCTVVSASNPYF